MDIKPKNILVPIDFRDQSLGALNQAISMASHLKRQIVLLYINQDKGVLSSLFSSEHDELFSKAVKEKLDDLAYETSNSNAVEIITRIISHSSINNAIVEFSTEYRSDLIIMGRGESKDGEVIGSNTSRVLRTSTVPVMTVCRNCTSPGVYRSILLPLDLSKETRQKVNWAILLAKLFNSKIRVISALWSKNDPEIIGQLRNQMGQVEKFLEKHDVDYSTEIIESSEDAKTLVPIILKYSNELEDLDLIMIMTQQENALTEFFLGSSASELIRKSQVPVLSIIPHETGQIVWGI